jgi:hypothetical protein
MKMSQAYTVKELREELENYHDDYIVWFSMDNMSAPVRIVGMDEDEEDRVVLK